MKEQRPMCSRCYNKDKACDYGTTLIWPDESLAKGVRHGREARQSSYSTAATRTNQLQLAPFIQANGFEIYFLNTNIADIEHHGYVTPQSRLEIITKIESPDLLQHRTLTPIPPCDEKLISFYDRVLCGATTVENNAQGNPFRAVLIPLALQSNAVLNALQAVSAKVLSLHQPSYRKATLLYHTEALSGLVGTIDNVAKNNECHFEACVLCLLLCWFEVSLCS